MSSFLLKKSSFRISKISDKDFCKFSLCPKDYKFLPTNDVAHPLEKFIINDALFLEKRFIKLSIGKKKHFKIIL